MEKLDLTKILKVGQYVYSPIFGYGKVVSTSHIGPVTYMEEKYSYPIYVGFFRESRKNSTTDAVCAVFRSFTKEGRYSHLASDDAECVLFPSKEERNWSEYISKVSENQHAGEVCSDNRFEIIDRAKQDLIERTNIETSPQEMMWLDDFLFRCWQMGWLKKYDDVEKN